MTNIRACCVLLIDDNEVDNFINENILRATGFSQVHVFTSGQSGLEFLRNIQKNIDYTREILPRILFVDLNMPFMNGFQFFKEFETLDKDVKEYVKLVVLTSSHDPEDERSAGLNKRILKYLKKPMNESDVLSLLNIIENQVAEPTQKIQY